ncbi:BrxA family protein [Paenibacillus sp. JTLBN-2024]
MSQELDYSATLTGASFLFYEFKQVVSLKEQGIDETEIKNRVLGENLFQYQVKSSLKRSLPSVLRRVNVLDDTLRKMVLEESLDTGKIINLYAIMKTDRLFLNS